MRWLNLERPELVVRATEHIREMAEYIQALAKKGIAYSASDGSYYFRVAKFPEYGKLSKKDLSGIEAGARVDVEEYGKEDPRDFALWKSPKEGEDLWDSPIGKGHPGWHIECSVMAMKYLGESFDLHGGGEDLAFPHHENEIAQAESLTGKIFARHWMHVRFLLVESDKMSRVPGISILCATLCCRVTSRPQSVSCWRPFLTASSSTSLLPDWSKAQSPWSGSAPLIRAFECPSFLPGPIPLRRKQQPKLNKKCAPVWTMT